MHAVRQHEFGPPETLRYEEVADPQPGPDEVRIAVAASGVHFIDTTIRKGIAGGPFPPPSLPMTPGREVAGVVDEVGADVDPAWLGKRVAVHLGTASGGYAELVVAPADSLHEVPPSLSSETAVAMLGTGRTAIGILAEAALTSDDVVLVTAAAGGMGTLFVQAARACGAVVVGAAGGPAKVDRVRSLGADVSVDYEQPGWTDAVTQALDGRSITALLDGVGGRLGQEAIAVVGEGGRVVLFGLSSGAPVEITTQLLMRRGLQVTWALGARMLRRAGGLRTLEEQALAAAAEGTLVPLVDTFPLAEAARAHAALEARATIGKVVLLPDR